MIDSEFINVASLKFLKVENKENLSLFESLFKVKKIKKNAIPLAKFPKKRYFQASS